MKKTFSAVKHDSFGEKRLCCRYIPAFQNRTLFLKAFRDQTGLAIFCSFVFTFFGSPCLFGPYARSFGPTGLGETFLGQRGYGNMAVRFVFVQNIFFPGEKTDGRNLKVALTRRGPTGQSCHGPITTPHRGFGAPGALQAES